ncbi:UNVERIFIED_CONTAM: hypothetical protein Slati_3395500 [Sesamum latifolium]|uniref:DEK-C domain-containing protein n=1 Tax=Sesamum latifolium TaxID=2727402 RepID=A0AAW2UI45_9LAMI
MKFLDIFLLYKPQKGIRSRNTAQGHSQWYMFLHLAIIRLLVLKYKHLTTFFINKLKLSSVDFSLSWWSLIDTCFIQVHTLKKNIGLFSGFVWLENEGKQRAKVKEKLDKCVKEKLLDFCDVLNIPVNRASVKKEELSAKLLEFLESPHATTDALLADKEKGKKRKSSDQASKTLGSSNVAAEKSTKKQKLDSESGKKHKYSAEEEDDEKSEPLQSDDAQDEDNKVPDAESDQEENESEEETDENEDQDEPKNQMVAKDSAKKSTKRDTDRSDEKSKPAGKRTPAKSSKTPGKPTKDSLSSASKKGAAESESKSKMKAVSTKKRKTEKESEKDTSKSAKDTASSKSSTKVLKKDQGEGKSSKKAKKEPSKEEMHAVVVDILKEVDFNTATLSDILRQLGKHFGIDLMHRKSEVKDIITEAIKNMSDDEDEEAAESGDESGKDGEDDEA